MMIGVRIAALLKGNGWLVNLILIALGAYFVAGAVNAVMAASIRVVPTVDDMPTASSSPRRSRSSPKGQLTSIAERNLFGAKREAPTAAENAAAEEESAAMVSGRNYKYEDLRPCTLPISVRGTLVAEGMPEWSFAVIYSNSERQAEAYSINAGSNELASDATLVDVLEREIVVRRPEHFELCTAEAEGKRPGRPSPRRLRGETPSSGGGVTKRGDGDYVIDGSLVDESLSNLNKVATQARIVPSFRNGKANGFKLFSIKPGSIYAKIGMQNGDVIQKINGYEINSPDKALEIYQKLKDASNLTIDFQRRGQSKSNRYEIDR